MARYQDVVNPGSNYIDAAYDYFLGTQGEYVPHFLAAFGRRTIPISALRHPAETSLRFDLQASAWMQDISPGVRIITNSFSEMDVVNLQYAFEHPGGVSNAFRAGNVGFGITYTLPIVLALLSARPGSLIILENPEAHLHPRGQSQMAKLISLAAANGVQVIVETHSDHILNGVRVAVHYEDSGNTLTISCRIGRVAGRCKSTRVSFPGRGCAGLPYRASCGWSLPEP
jgi:predicted ATPase